MIALQTTDRNGRMVGALRVPPDDEVMLISSGGTLVRTPVSEISVQGRNTQGVRLIRLDEGDRLVGLERIVADSSERRRTGGLTSPAGLQPCGTCNQAVRTELGTRMPFKILTLNNISVRGLERLPRDRYEVASDLNHPDAIMVRSADMHAAEIPASRPGDRTGRRRHEQHSRGEVLQGGYPGIQRARRQCQCSQGARDRRHVHRGEKHLPGMGYVRNLKGDDHALEDAVEKAKKKFVGFELPGRTLGVVGLGAIGVEVANAAHALGMRVLGFDPQITVQRAWQLSSGVEQALSLDDLFARADMVTVHVPLVDGTRGLVNAARLKLMKPKGVILNFARAGIVDEKAMAESLNAGHTGGYICDFPSVLLKDHSRVVALPHLGASTGEAEENCAIMVADTLRDFLENGNVRNSVNFPEAVLPRTMGPPASESPMKTCPTWSARFRRRWLLPTSTSPTCSTSPAATLRTR